MPSHGLLRVTAFHRITGNALPVLIRPNASLSQASHQKTPPTPNPPRVVGEEHGQLANLRMLLRRVNVEARSRISQIRERRPPQSSSPMPNFCSQEVVSYTADGADACAPMTGGTVLMD